ncbi:MAG: pyrophosphokinae [Clostridiales bacterium]|jgi:putative GTP pyrophosphokinase|nr:pyrophosphokinae [Clostridiales bacterium]
MYEALFTEKDKHWRDLLLRYKFAVDEMRTRLNILDEEFRTVHDYNPIEHIRYRIKHPDRIVEKLGRLGFEPTVENAENHIFDIAGIRIICAFTADIYALFTLLERQTDLKIVNVKDYIEHPKENGYKSLHVHVEVPVYMSQGIIPVRVEIQLRTIAMDFWASVEHKLYYKYREKAPVHIQAQLKECADMISTLDDRMYRLKAQISDLDPSAAQTSGEPSPYFTQDKEKAIPTNP